jgi:hypothetical protein
MDERIMQQFAGPGDFSLDNIEIEPFEIERSAPSRVSSH